LVTNSDSILGRWINHFSLLLEVPGINGVKQTIHTAEPLVPELSVFEFELAIEKLKSHKLPSIDHIPAELITTGVEQFAIRAINLFPFEIRKNCLRSGRS